MTAETSLLDQALADLASGRRSRQAAAHETVMQMAEGSVWKDELLARLPELMKHRNAHVRGTAYLALATAKGADALSLLEPRLDEREADARLDLTEALAGLGEPAHALLLKLVRDPIFEVRFAAAGGLVALADGTAIDTLIEGLKHSDTRYLSLSALQRLGDARGLEPARRIFGKLFLSSWERIAAAGVLARLGDAEGRAWLLDRVARRKGADRGLAIEIAGELKLVEVREALHAALADPKDPFRGSCTRVLGMLGDPAEQPTIEKLLFDAGEEVETRMDAAEGLMNLGTPEARAALERALQQLEGAEGVAAEELREVLREALASFGGAGEQR